MAPTHVESSDEDELEYTTDDTPRGQRNLSESDGISEEDEESNGNANEDASDEVE